MRAQEITFLKLVQGENQFQVPLYQRTYSWTRTELQQLWDDVADLAEQQLDGAVPSSHFLGSVVLAPGRVEAGGLQQWLVVDGQQRLTTIMLALAALRDHIRREDSDAARRTADRIHRQFLVNEFHDGDGHYRLLPTQADRPSFAACLSRAPQAGGADNVGAAYRFFLDVIASGQAEHGPAWPGAVETTLRDLLSIVAITAEHGDNVYRIFESINNTGVRLSQSDLLRNYVFMLLPNRGERVYEQLWLPMQQKLGPKNLELLVWLDLVLRGDDKAKQTEIYRSQQQRLDELAGDEAAVEAAVAELAGMAELFGRILDPALEPHPGLRQQLQRLSDWGGRTHFAAALHLLRLVSEGRAGEDEAAEALGFVESYVVRRLLCESKSNNYNRIFNSLPRDLDPALPPARAVRAYLSGRRRGWPTDSQVAAAVRTKPFYWAGQSQQRTFVLRRLEESYESAEPVDYERARMTVEHILPQRPAEAWFDLLAEDTDHDETPEDLHEMLVHTLGNLTLSAENSRLSNHPFQRKQQILEGSALRMNQEIAATPRWGRPEIHSRANRLAARAIAMWPGPDAQRTADDDEWSGWGELRSALIAMPAGTWTTYGDIAQLIGSHPRNVGNYLAAGTGIPGAHRVLAAGGRVSATLRWPAGGPTYDPVELLVAEGVPFDSAGRARRSCRLTAEDLATLLNKDPGAADASVAREAGADRSARFSEQLRTNQPTAAEAVLGLLGQWTDLGPHCRLEFGKALETSCFLMVDKGAQSRQESIWPFALYPVLGTVEVVFQHLRTRPPFDDIELRREFMLRLNKIDGIELAEAKLGLRPSFPLEVLALHPGPVLEALDWFAESVGRHRGEG
ncbi:GmrSD restriction endonuclease domain-containing protein [Kitasatospora sp. NPDC003701]